MKINQIRDWLLQLSLALIIFFGFLRPFVIEAFRIPTPSMEETLLVGDHLLVLKSENGQQIPYTDKMQPILHNFRDGDYGLLMPATGSIEVGDILVFKTPAESRRGDDFIKRVVAVAGDTIRISHDTLYVNGAPSPEFATLYQDAYSPSPLENGWPGNIAMLSGALRDFSYFEMRDNCIPTSGTPEAYVVPEGTVFMMGDNRDHSGDSRVWGALPLSYIKGKALITYWSWIPGSGFPKIDRIARIIR